MAFVSNGWFLSVSLADNGGNVTTKRYELTAADAATAATDVAAIIAALDPITNAEILSYNYGQKFVEDTVVYPLAGVENEDKASLTVLLTTGGGKKANHKIPAPKITIFTDITGPGANIVDVGDADLLAYMALFGVGGKAYISDGEVMDSLLSGKRISAKSNNG